VLRNLHRQSLDGDLAADLREHAALGHANGLTDQLHDDLRLDRLVEPHLLEIHVDDPAAYRVLLVVLENRRMRGLLAFQGHVEDRVQARVAREHAPQLALRDRDRVRFLAAPVEDARDQPLLAQTARFGGAATFALRYLQLHPFAGHRRGSLARTGRTGKTRTASMVGAAESAP